MVSKEAKIFRQQLCEILADIMCQRIIKLFGQGITVTQYSRTMLANGPSNRESGLSTGSSFPAYDYDSILRDRRLRLIFFKALKSASRDRILMLRFYWTSVLMIVTSSILACYRVLVSVSQAYLQRLSEAPKRYAVSAWYSHPSFRVFTIWKREYFFATIYTRIQKNMEVYLFAGNALGSFWCQAGEIVT